ncbi:MAG: hypothetical protein EON59_09285 [Alphaproteobacteria bacterium]|nr:MAG: hypothetical protein EON59_09285 [Alphaproteobacteria bacterium]
MQTTICEDVRAALGQAEYCEETEHGARVITHCLHPSFEQAEVFVHRYGGGYRVTDAGGAYSSAWTHGRDKPSIAKALEREALRHHLTVSNGALLVEVPSIEWLGAAVLAVANASAAASNAAVESAVASLKADLSERIYAILAEVAPSSAITREASFTGRSGTPWRVDYAVAVNDNLLLVNGITPHPVSINQKYTEFSDLSDMAGAVERFAVTDAELKQNEALLIGQVADIVAIGRLGAGARRALGTG